VLSSPPRDLRENVVQVSVIASAFTPIGFQKPKRSVAVCGCEVREIMRRANVVNEEACQSLLLKMRDEGLVKLDIQRAMAYRMMRGTSRQD
jgi:hypothetical protein